jgi:hypothetical protein
MVDTLVKRTAKTVRFGTEKGDHLDKRPGLNCRPKILPLTLVECIRIPPVQHTYSLSCETMFPQPTTEGVLA